MADMDHRLQAEEALAARRRAAPLAKVSLGSLRTSSQLGPSHPQIIEHREKLMSEAAELQRVVGDAGLSPDRMSPRTANDRLAQKLAATGLSTSPDSGDPGSPPMDSHAKYLRNLRRGPASPDQVSPGGSPSSMVGSRGPASPTLINMSNLMKLAEGGMRRSVGTAGSSNMGSLSPRDVPYRPPEDSHDAGGSFLPFPGPPHRQPSGGSSDKRFASVEKALERERRISAVERGQPIERSHRLSQVDRRPVDGELEQAGGEEPAPRGGLPPRQASGGKSGAPLIPRRRTSEIDRTPAMEELRRYGSADLQGAQGEANGRPRRMSDVDRGAPRVSQVDERGGEGRTSQVDQAGRSGTPSDGLASSRERRVSEVDRGGEGGGRARRISQVDQVGRASSVDPPGAPLAPPGSARERRISQVDQVGRASTVDPPGAPLTTAGGGRERRISQVDQAGRASGAQHGASGSINAAPDKAGPVSEDSIGQRPRRTSHVDDVQERARRMSQAEDRGRASAGGDSQPSQRARRASEVDQRPRRTSSMDQPGAKGVAAPASTPPPEGEEYRGRRTSVVDSERQIDRDRRAATMERTAERDRAKAAEQEKRSRAAKTGGATGELAAAPSGGSTRPSSHRTARRLSQSEMPSMTTDNATRMRRLSQTVTSIPSIKAVAGSMAEEAQVSLKVAGIQRQPSDEASRYVTDYLQGCEGFAIIGMVSEMGQERDEWKRDNQDKCLLVDDYGVNKNEVLLGVFDGHGPSGTSAAEFVADDMKEEMFEQMDSLLQNPAAVFSHAFQTVNMNLRRSYVDCKLSGTTAAVVHIKETALTCAWVGDSRAVLGRLIVNEQGFSIVQAVQLTADHKPGLPDETSRITVSGGRVDRLIIDETGERVGPLRVFTKYTWSPGLAISRSMGDIFAHDVGVIAEPDVRSHVLKPSDRFLILGTKGLWAFMSNEDAVSSVVGNRNPQDAAQLLLSKAKELWQQNEGDTRDDISVIVVNFNHEALEEAAEARREYAEDNYTDYSEADA